MPKDRKKEERTREMVDGEKAKQIGEASSVQRNAFFSVYAS